MRRLLPLLLLLLSPAPSPAGQASPPASPPGSVPFDAGVVSGLGIRNIGSAAMSGRVSAIAARAGDDGKTVVYVGAASGGVWRSLDSGTTFRPVFDTARVQQLIMRNQDAPAE